MVDLNQSKGDRVRDSRPYKIFTVCVCEWLVIKPIEV